ncbi:thiamine pyrophosphate-dependent enzyme [Pseudomonadota bacterium]
MNNVQKIWQALQGNGVDKVAYLPCNKLNALMSGVPDAVEVLNITRESVGLGLCFGRSLAGKRSAMMIQNTGLGNLVTELYTMQKLYREGLPIFVSWRGFYKEPIEAQVIFGSKVEDLLKAIDVEYRILRCMEDVDAVGADVAGCFSENKVKVFLLSPEVWEVNSPDYHVFGRTSLDPISSETEAYRGQPALDRIGAIRVIMDSIGEESVVISQIGFPSKEVYNTRDRALNFYMLGALGSATEVGIGLAGEVGERHVCVVDGDGSFFFNPNQLIDLATFDPGNLTVICLDNGSWGSTGNQPTLSSAGMNLSAIIRAMGLHSVVTTDDAAELQQGIVDRVRFVHYMIRAGNDKAGGEVPLTAVEIKERFMGALGSQ